MRLDDDDDDDDDGDFKGCGRGLLLYQHLPGQAKEKEDS
jgi:hypothetical protein